MGGETEVLPTQVDEPDDTNVDQVNGDDEIQPSGPDQDEDARAQSDHCLRRPGKPDGKHVPMHRGENDGQALDEKRGKRHALNG